MTLPPVGAAGLTRAVRDRLAALPWGEPPTGPGESVPHPAGVPLPAGLSRPGGPSSAALDGPGGVAAQVRDVAAGSGRVLGVGELVRAASSVRAQLWGLGPLEPLLADPAVTDVLVNGGGRVWVDRGSGLVEAGTVDGGEAAVRALATRLAAAAGRRLDEGCPWADARLPGGLRLHAVLPPLAPEGTHVSLRVLGGARAGAGAGRGALGVAELEACGSLDPVTAEVLAALVRARCAVLVSGGTGAGKTTLLAALLSLVPATERIVLVEDVGELAPDHPHVVRLEARPANVEGRGEVGLAELVRQALRMRPDRLVVGECRGAEVRDLLAALNTGHAGGFGTVHANSAEEVPARLEALGALAGLGPRAVRLQARAALDAVVHVVRDGGARRVQEVGVLLDDGSVQTALRRVGPGPATPGPGWERLVRRLGGDLPPAPAGAG